MEPFAALLSGAFLIILFFLGSVGPACAASKHHPRAHSSHGARAPNKFPTVSIHKRRKLAAYIHKKFRVPEKKAEAIVAQAVRTGRKHDIHPELILAVIAVESHFRPRALSRKGARGLMQVLPRWHPKRVKAIGGTPALFEVDKNISAGTQILALYIDDSDGDLRRALLRYNGSVSSRSHYPDKVLSQYHRLRLIADSAS